METTAQEIKMSIEQQVPVEERAHGRPTITVSVNNRSVVFHEHRVTGAEIKATAIAQGVSIQPDFILYEVKPGRLTQIDDAETVTIHERQAFRALAPDDNS